MSNTLLIRIQYCYQFKHYSDKSCLYRVYLNLTCVSVYVQQISYPDCSSLFKSPPYLQFNPVQNINIVIFREEPFIPYIDSLPSLKRNVNGPFMMPIVDKFTDMGTVVIGKVESGQCSKGQTLAIYPNKQEVKVDQVHPSHVIAQLVAYWLGTGEVLGSNPGKGENFSMKISN